MLRILTKRMSKLVGEKENEVTKSIIKISIREINFIKSHLRTDIRIIMTNFPHYHEKGSVHYW